MAAPVVDRGQKMTVTRLTTSGDVSGCGSISPDGRYVVYCDFGGTQVRQVATGSTVDLGQIVGATTFSPDGDFVYVTATTPRTRRAPCSPFPRWAEMPRRVLIDIAGAVGVLPDGKRSPSRAAIRRRARSPSSWRTSTAATRSGWPPVTWTPLVRRAGVSWSPDGKRLAVTQGSVVGGYRLRPVIVDVATGRSSRSARQTWVDLGRPVWLPDGSGVLFPARERSEGAFQFWIARYPGGERGAITNDARGFGDMSVSVTADGSTIATVPWDIVSNLFTPTPMPARRSSSGRRASGSTARRGWRHLSDGRLSSRPRTASTSASAASTRRARVRAD